MQYTRKEFLKTAAMSMAAVTVGNSLMACSSSSAIRQGKRDGRFGLQLWTIKEDMYKDPRGVLEKVAAMGYKQIESFEGDMGIFWGMKNTEFKKLMDDLGMTIISSHCDINKDFERKAAEAAEIGMKYLIDAWVGPQKNIDEFKKAADMFNQRGEICKKAGIRFGYHNHDYPFKPVDGQKPMDVMIQNTDASMVDFEMDIYWVVVAGEDPVKWFEKYPGRFKLCHVKDREKDQATGKSESCILGKGDIDFKKILKEGARKGLQYYIVEQEYFAGTTRLEAAAADAAYMKKL